MWTWALQASRRSNLNEFSRSIFIFTTRTNQPEMLPNTLLEGSTEVHIYTFPELKPIFMPMQSYRRLGFNCTKHILRRWISSSNMHYPTPPIYSCFTVIFQTLYQVPGIILWRARTERRKNVKTGTRGETAVGNNRRRLQRRPHKATLAVGVRGVPEVQNKALRNTCATRG